MRTSEDFWGRNEFGLECRDTQLTSDETLRACVDNLLCWDDESARSGTSLGCTLTACPYSSPIDKSALVPMVLIRSTGAAEEFLQLIRVASFLALVSHFSHQRF